MLDLLRRGVPNEAASRIDALAVAALTDELTCYPKPGLVSPVDSGSHEDMDAVTFRASIAALAGYFGAMATTAAAGASFETLNAFGRAAEARMLAATGGVNTHRGAVFSLGLAAAGAGASRSSGVAALCRTLSDRWGADILAAGRLAREPTHGHAVRSRYGVTGPREEAAAGFPTVIGHALPAFRAALRTGASRNDALVQALFAILSALEDNNLLYRGGPAALERAQRLALDFLAAGGILAPGGRDRGIAIHRLFVAERMSPGGAADLLVITAFLARVEEAHQEA